MESQYDMTRRSALTYGNIGTTRRLDFTVIGPAVNEAARIEELCKSLGEPVLASSAFALCAHGELKSLGQHSFRGVRVEEEIFAPPDGRRVRIESERRITAVAEGFPTSGFTTGEALRLRASDLDAKLCVRSYAHSGVCLWRGDPIYLEST